jgi:tetratricopeptide (TPR) repeat protein
VGPVTFELLTKEQQAFVVSQHAIAFEAFKNRDFDKALFEVEKIFALIPDYENARAIERYAREGKRKMEALEEEARKKEEEARIKAKIEQMVGEIRDAMTKKDYGKAQNLFPELLAIDPENAEVSGWKKQIEESEEARRLTEAEKQVQREINQRAWDVFREGMRQKKKGHFHTAIETFLKVPDIGASDKKVLGASKAQIAICKSAIHALLEPVLAAAKQKEDAGEFPEAFALYRKATKIDPPHPGGYAGIERIKGVLHERAKMLYTEAVLAESYSDFAVAKTKFEECLKVAPEDDIYHGRALRKIGRYFKSGDPPQ